MRLGYKIFISILSVSLIVYFLVSYMLVEKSHSYSLEQEIERSQNEFILLEESIETNLSTIYTNTTNTNYIKDIVKKYSNYYSKRKVLLAYFSDDKLMFDGLSYSTDTDNTDIYSDLLSVSDGSYDITVNTIENKQYIMLSTKFSEKDYLIYIRDVTNIYESKYNLYKTCLLSGAILVIILGLVSFFLSRIVTKPLRTLKNCLTDIEDGKYDFNLKEGSDEIGQLSSGFNKMSQTIMQRETKLEYNIASRQTFIDNLAHEMNTPLTAIQGYAELLEKGNISQDGKNLAMINIQKETKRIKSMYQKLRTISLLNNEDELEIRNIAVHELFNDIQLELEYLLNDKCILLQLENNTIDNCVIIGDPILLHILFSNLIRNALNYSEPETCVKFIINTDKSISIKDQGIGISEDKLNNIFEPFYRIDKSRSRKTGGSGLGLALCKTIVELHKGTITVKSKLNEGTTVTVSLPQ